MPKPRLSIFEQTARTHEAMAAGLERAIKDMPPIAKPAILREIAHHLECAARMRGQHLQ